MFFFHSVLIFIAKIIGRLQAMMATYGIQTQTPHEVSNTHSFIHLIETSICLLFFFCLHKKVEPVQIWSSTQLIKIFQELGVNEKIGLTGRPNRPVGSLGTSKVRNCKTSFQSSISIAVSTVNIFDQIGVSCMRHDRIVLSTHIRGIRFLLVS